MSSPLDKQDVRDMLSDILYEAFDNQDEWMNEEGQIKDWHVRNLQEMGFLGDPFGLHWSLDGKPFLLEIKDDPSAR